MEMEVLRKSKQTNKQQKKLPSPSRQAQKKRRNHDVKQIPQVGGDKRDYSADSMKEMARGYQVNHQ